jgi:hypothetical protein
MTWQEWAYHRRFADSRLGLRTDEFGEEVEELG